MPDYAKMKNAELEALLKDRGLPTGGKKSDMAERLTKDDEKRAELAAPAPSKLSAEDEIDWDDDEAPAEAAKAAPAVSSEKKETATIAPAATTEPDITAKAGGKGQPPNPQAVPNQVADIDPSKTDDLSVKPPAEDKEPSAGPKAEDKKEPAPDYTKGLAATNIDEEIEKRKARAKKFGLNIEEDEGLKKLERMKKFGETGPPKGLDEALPERRKRGREENDDNDRNKRRGGGRFTARRGRGNRDGDRRRDNRDIRDPRDSRDSRDSRRQDRGNADGGGAAAWMTADDRRKADERKAKWAKPAA
ncbi:hypothetical protein BU26DRAFT_144365 [Trematosphaeria pertusa]|uniref:SAP domain-containing protein n=1 Tax=Trematosphaeria pertusa TaxID=390896 RepID=A0A6A6IYN3_9PLEO|nr:uncharacterized protein BU26DRAFT_144365 [Trematosphaeria pertusa]KAF2254730.1 hypothetical protein BU26DRAFT_144365 [Trematosphaeria pertusa]